MKDPFGTWLLRTSAVTPSATSSPVSASGPMPSVSQDGPTTDPSGPAPAPASHSAPPERDQDLPTSVTSGLSSTGSSASAALQLSLESRLRVRTASAGSTLYSLTWKHRATPLGRQICALRASAPRTSASASGLLEKGWVTTTTRDWKDSGADIKPRGDGSERFDQLPRQANLAGWPTPNTMTGGQTSRGGDRKGELLMGGMAQLAGWPTPMTQDDNCSRVANPQEYAVKRLARKGASSNLAQTAQAYAWATAQDGPARLTATGELLTGSTAAMESGGQLRPAHSRWLMGLPRAWDECAPRQFKKSRKP